MDLTIPGLNWPLLGLLEAVWVVVLSVYILLEGRSPLATLAWILSLALLPGVGLVVYLLLGPRRLVRKRNRRSLARALVASAASARSFRESRMLTAEGAVVGDPALSLAEAAIRSGEAPPLRCRSITVYERGHAFFDALEQAIDEARHHVHLEFYIFEEGRVASRLQATMLRAAARGVEVRLLVDGLGSRTLSWRFVGSLREGGVQVAIFNPVAFASFRPPLLNFRSHRKLVCIDGEVGFVGGMNVQDGQDETVAFEKAWRDTHVRLVGDAVAPLALVFLEDWTFATGDAPSGQGYLAATTGEGEHLVQIVASGPDTDAKFAIHGQFFTAIATALERVYLATPYFVPDEATTMALASAARRGVDVRLMLPAEGDHPFVSAAARAYFPALLEAGVKIYAYGPRVLHGKTLVVDRHYAAVGSANFDNRSFRLNFEAIAAIFDAGIADRLAASFVVDQGDAKLVTRSTFARRGFGTRLYEAIARLFSPLL